MTATSLRSQTQKGTGLYSRCRAQVKGLEADWCSRAAVWLDVVMGCPLWVEPSLGPPGSPGMGKCGWGWGLLSEQRTSPPYCFSPRTGPQGQVRSPFFLALVT